MSRPDHEQSKSDSETKTIFLYESKDKKDENIKRAEDLFPISN